jgi:hypothetical protein
MVNLPKLHYPKITLPKKDGILLYAIEKNLSIT